MKIQKAQLNAVETELINSTETKNKREKKQTKMRF